MSRGNFRTGVRQKSIFPPSLFFVYMTYDHAPEKVLSTQLSMTELLIKLGLKDKIVGVFDNDNALKGDIADEIASLNSLGDKKSVSKETILATEPDLILGKGPLMFTESSIRKPPCFSHLLLLRWKVPACPFADS